ncbi:MAG TPA: ATP-binding protein [Gaiellaceae bacterium]|nr:ATP-binding protein [Gaiellaceae bacterium]
MTRGGPEDLAALVHELRSPVAALDAIAAAYREIDRAGRRELVSLVLAACAAVARVVREASATSLRREPVDPAALARQAAAAARLGGALVSVEAEDGLPLLHADPVRLRQALDNLLRNASLHGGEGPIRVEARRGEGGTVELSVSDTGPGLPAEEIERIFEPGVRLVPGGEGEGLGLAIVREIVQAHGGTVTAISPPGGGARFTISLPSSAPAAPQ